MHLIHGSVGLHVSAFTSGISVGLAVFAGLTGVPNRRTDYATSRLVQQPTVHTVHAIRARNTGEHFEGCW